MYFERPTSYESGCSVVNFRTMCALLLLMSVTMADDLPAVPVRTGILTSSRVGATRVFIGTVEAARSATVGSPVAGRVVQVFVEEGDAVTINDSAHDVLVQLEPDAARIAVDAAQAALEVAQHELAELKAGPRPEELRRLEADVRRTNALLTHSTKTLRRLEGLYERKAVVDNELEAAVSAQRAAEEASKVAVAHLDEARVGTREERLAQARAKQLLAQHEVRRLEDLLNKHTIRAPFGGYVVKRFVEQGTWVGQGDPVMQILEMDPVEVRVAVPEEVVSRVSQGMPVRIDVGAVRVVAPQSEVLVGEVFRIVPSADVRTRSFPVRIRIANPIHGDLPLLKPGMLARVHLPVGQDEESLLVPRDALVLDGRRTSIFVVDQIGTEATVREVTVEVGSAHEALIQVRPERGTELSADMSVVTEGNERLTNGQSVTVLDPELNASRDTGP